MAGGASVAQSGSRRHKQRHRSRLLLEPLEDRYVLTTLTPTTFADGVLGSGSLRDAVLQFNADSGSGDDTILLQSGTYALTIGNSGGQHETAGLSGDLNLTSASHRWIIQGAGSSGPNATVIDAGQLQDRVFEIMTPGTQVVFKDLILQGGLAQDDGSNGALAGTTDALGGGILNNGGTVRLDNVVVQSNVARGGDAAALAAAGHNARGGGVYSNGGALTLVGATIANNQATGGRGGDHTGGAPGGDGGSAGSGGLYATGGSLDISHSRIASNGATGGQGGDGYLTVNSRGTYYTGGGNGGPGQGGGLYVNGGSFTIATSTIDSNQATGGSGGLGNHNGTTSQGGGIYNQGTLTVSNSILSGNSAGAGGGIDNQGTLGVSDSIVSGNYASGFSGSGGGINNGGTATISNSTLSSNTASFGGGIENNQSHTLTISNSTLSDNHARQGGGIENGLGAVTISNSTLSGNFAISTGGGIDNEGTLTVSNSTLSSNFGGNGGGIWTAYTYPVTLANVTLAANRANGGGGLYVAQGSPVLHDTLVAGNFRGATGTNRDDVFGALNRGGDYNLIGDGTGMSGLRNGVRGNLVGSAYAPIDPLLGPLQDNGGPTQTMALLAGSPAIDAGDPNYTGPPFTDQRGFARVYNGRIDIGAFEFQPVPLTLTNTGSSGPGSLSQALVAATNPAAVSDSTPAITAAIPATGPGSSSMATASPAAAGPAAVSNTLPVAPGDDGSNLGSALSAEGQRALLDETRWAALGYHGRNDAVSATGSVGAPS
jgi:hypothetical protein